MVTFKHLLLTRFAIRFEPQDPRARFEMDSKWMQKRFELFEKYTLRSVKAQTNKNFDWILFVDRKFKNLDIKRLSSYGIDIAWIYNKYWDHCNFEDTVKKYSEGYKWVITSRLDSDDMVCKTYINDIQQSFNYERAWFSHERGYMVRDDRAYPRRFPNSPFVSYAELATNPIGVYHTTHMRAGYNAPLILFKDHPGWVQIDHGDNIRNSIKRKKLIDWVPIDNISHMFGGMK